MSPELKQSRWATCLELEIECCMCNVQSATQDCKVFTKSETAPLETIPLTEDSMQTEVLKDATDFGTKIFCSFKDKGLILAA